MPEIYIYSIFTNAYIWKSYLRRQRIKHIQKSAGCRLDSELRSHDKLPENKLLKDF